MTEAAPLRRFPDGRFPDGRFPEGTRAQLRALLLAELTAARRRGLAAGCPPEVLRALFEARRRSVAEYGRVARAR